MPKAPCLGLLLAAAAFAPSVRAQNADAIAPPPVSPVADSAPATRGALNPSITDSTVPAVYPQPAASKAMPTATTTGAVGPPRPREEGIAVPEPSVLLLVGGGLVWLALAKRRVRVRAVRMPLQRGPATL